MTLRLLTSTWLLALVLTACTSVQKVTDPSYSNTHNSQNSLDWSGTYSGITPCASYPGIETELILTSDLDYILTRKYMESKVADTVKGIQTSNIGGVVVCA